MKAVVKFAPGIGNIEVREVEEPKVGSNQVKIEVKRAGICGTDIHIYYEEFKSNPPVILGHEFCGVVAEVGEGVEGIKPGDRVTSETAANVCGKCWYCRTGNYNLCPERRGLGYWFNGAFTKYCVVPAERVHLLPDNVDFTAGALCEPLSSCTHGVLELTGISAGDVVVVLGPGAIGLIALQLAKIEGGRVVICGISVDKERLKLAPELGAERTINIEEEDPLKIVKEMTAGYGADVVLECSGAPPAANLGLELVRKQGKYTQLGLFGKSIQVDFEKIAYKEIKVTGFFTQKWTAWKKALSLLGQGKVQTKPLVSEELPLTEWKKGFEKFAKKEGIKILLYPVD